MQVDRCTKNVEEIQFNNQESFKRCLLGLANKYVRYDLRELDMARKERHRRVSSRTVNKRRFPIGEYKYAMRNLEANYLLECKSLQKEKEKLDSVLGEVSLMNLCVYSVRYM